MKAQYNIENKGFFFENKKNKKKTPALGRRIVIEAGFIQARNLSSSNTCIYFSALSSKYIFIKSRN